MARKATRGSAGIDPQMSAFQAIYTALSSLDEADRQKVLSSVASLLELAPPHGEERALEPQRNDRVRQEPSAATARPLSLIELVQQKKPHTNVQLIATFAYYREKYEGHQRFHRDDLEGYFAKAKETPASNYNRDFGEAVKKGWIHEDGADSYLTSKGLEVVESGFEGERGGQPRSSKVRGSRKRKNAKGRWPTKKR
jgi:hypothetical protein